MHIVNSLNHAINGQDGRFSSGAFGLVLTSFCVVFIIVNTSQHPGEIETKSWTVEGMVIPLGVLSTIGLWVSVLRRNRRQLRNDSDRHLTHRIKIVFLWIFGLMCIIMACYDVAVNVDCLISNRPYIIEGDFELGVATHSFKILFYLAQLGFLSSFASYSFVTSIIQNYMISCVILSHLVIWFLNFYRTTPTTLNIDNKTITFQNSCFFQQSNQEFRNKLNPFTKPAITEFSLLAAELFMMMLVSSWNGTPDEEEDEFNYVTGVDEITSLISEPVDNSSNTPRRQYVITNTFYICILVGTLLSLPYVVSSVVILYSEQSSFRYYEAFVTILLIFYIEHFALIVATFVQLRNFSQWRNIRITTFSKNTSFLLVMTLIGAIVYCTFETLATIEVTECIEDVPNLSVSKIRSTALTKNILELLTMLLQTILIRQAWHMEKCTDPKKIQTIKRLFGTLCLINLVLWLVVSILFDTQTRTMLIEVCFFGKENWNRIRSGLLPITVFYRFHASMHFYERCRKYN